MTEPKVSIILPFYEGESWLTRSMGSVLSQEGVPFELLIVDDGSSRSPEDLVRSFHDGRIHLYRIDHAGKGAALNCGARKAKAPLLCFIDQDDVMLPGRLNLQLGAFCEHPDAEIVYSDYERVRDDGSLIDRFVSRQATGMECLRAMVEGRGLVSMQTMMIRKETFGRIGGFSEDISLTGLDDAEFFVRLFASGAALLYRPGAVQQWVRHEGNYSEGEPFQAARLVLLQRLDAAARQNPGLADLLPLYRYHCLFMRGLYFLQHSRLQEAVASFRDVVRLRPWHWVGYYLLAKAWILARFRDANTDKPHARLSASGDAGKQ
jgi:glycosyltransferase involved in cell wall biosynthesis